MLLTHDETPIVALCTPRGSGALALLRVSGVGACAVVSSIAKLSSQASLDSVATHTIHHGQVIDPSNQARTCESESGVFACEAEVKGLFKVSGNCVDEVMFLVMHAPRTFTGQETVEITCHNNPFIINSITTLLSQQGARLAEAGEFSKRAFLSGKLDLIQAEAIHDLITAQTEVALRQSLAQLQGSFSHHIAQLEADLLEILCYAEASFEFLDEEQQDLQFDDRIRGKIHELSLKLGRLLIDHSRQKQIKEGIRVALIGSVNAGKSTLFNALLGKNRAIVSDQAGTTRDSIEATLYRDGTFWLLIDTAGLRQTGDVIEQQGIERSWHEAELADIILLVIDAGASLSEEQQALHNSLCAQYRDKIVVILNKCDTLSGDSSQGAHAAAPQGFDPITVSAHHKLGIDQLNARLSGRIQELFSRYHSPYLLNERQHDLIFHMDRKIKTVEKNYSDRIEYELLAHVIREMLESLCQLTGKNIHEKMLDKIFSDFCVGK